MRIQYRRKWNCFFLILAVTLSSILTPALPLQAAPANSLQLPQAKILALTNSASYRKIKNKIAAQEISYQSAVKAIQLKKKTMATFKWSPLLSFKFPESPKLADEYEFTYKPLQIQSQITSLKHQLADEVYSVYETTSNLFVQIYTLQESIAFDEQCLAAMRTTLGKNQARLLTGEANQTDITKMEKAVTTLNDKLAAQQRDIEEKKNKLTDLIGMDVTTQYTFQNPYVKGRITRDDLKKLEDSALEKDQSYYETKMTTQLCLVSLNTYYSLMKNQYGGKMWHVDSYVNLAKSGNKIDTDAMKQSFEALIKDVDAPWQGRFWIIFIPIPKEWIKGQISGVRYVEEDPYALFTAILDYQEACNDQETARKELISNVDATFNTMISAKNSYESLSEEVNVLKEEVQKSLLLNSLGEVTYEELKDVQDEYEGMQREALDALDTYTQILYSYDRLTCGAVSALLYGGNIDVNPAIGGNSYLVADAYSGASYYIKSIVEDNAFEVGVYIPEDFEIEVTHFELWVDDTKVGGKVPLEQTIRHLTLTKEEYEKVFLRFYSEDKFVDDCEINPKEYQGPLELIGGYHVETEQEQIIGTYQTEHEEGTNLVGIKITPTEGQTFAYYTIENSAGKKLYSQDYIGIDTKFRYLSVIGNDLETLTIKVYTEEKELLYTGYFDTANLSIKVEPQ